jgi:hypothetical protein
VECVLQNISTQVLFNSMMMYLLGKAQCLAAPLGVGWWVCQGGKGGVGWARGWLVGEAAGQQGWRLGRQGDAPAAAQFQLLHVVVVCKQTGQWKHLGMARSVTLRQRRGWH